MGKNFAAIAFTDAVKVLQEKHGSRENYERIEKHNVVDGLTTNEIAFIEDLDSFYMASYSANEFPYIQHRGGPKGFLKVLDTKRLGFIDFGGNKQYITVGNAATNQNVALIMINYAAKARLKILAKIEIVELDKSPDLYELLNLDDYKFRPERMMVFNIEAYDWNCPQHITPRFSIDEVKEVFSAELSYIATLEKQIIELKAKLKND